MPKVPAALATTILAVALGAAACAPPPDLTEGRSTTARPIFGGAADTNPAHAAVVALSAAAYSGIFCTGTLIERDLVLTAAHCLEDLGAHEITVLFGDRVNQAAAVLSASAFPHADYDPAVLTNDIGLLRLATPSDVPPIPPLPESIGLDQGDIGALLDFSGFGVTEDGSDGTKLHVAGALGLVCPGPAPCTFAGEEVVPRAIAYAQREGGPCMGDSGGPAFIVKDGVEYVAGVTSYGDEDCTAWGVSTLVSSFAAFLSSSPQPEEENCGTTGDEDQDGAADCDDSDCVDAAPCVTPPTPAEACGNATDDDGDGAVDCGDSDCDSAAGCAEQGSGGCGCSAAGASGGGTLMALVLASAALVLVLRRW